MSRRGLQDNQNQVEAFSHFSIMASLVELFRTNLCVYPIRGCSIGERNEELLATVRSGWWRSGTRTVSGSEIKNGYDDKVHEVWKADDSDEGP
jgi:hypothetical protein